MQVPSFLSLDSRLASKCRLATFDSYTVESHIIIHSLLILGHPIRHLHLWILESGSSLTAKTTGTTDRSGVVVVMIALLLLRVTNLAIVDAHSYPRSVDSDPLVASLDACRFVLSISNLTIRISVGVEAIVTLRSVVRPLLLRRRQLILIPEGVFFIILRHCALLLLVLRLAS